jgi:hypothetical protein
MALCACDMDVKRRYIFMFDVTYMIGGHAGRGC